MQQSTLVSLAVSSSSLRDSLKRELRGVSSLQLSWFRNHHQQSWDISAPMVTIVGENGAGKTNVLEALSLLSPGRGLRSAKLSQMSTLQTKRPWVISSSLSTEVGNVQIGTSLDSGMSYSENGESIPSERRLIRINQTPVKSQSVLGDWVNVIWVVPSMARLFDEAAGLRRKFVDRMVVALDPSHNERVHRYEHFLRERSILLKTQGRLDGAWLDTLEHRLAEDGVAITQSRALLVHQLTRSQPQDIDSPFPRFYARMGGQVEDWCRTLSAIDAEDCLRQHLKKSRSQDAQTGGSIYGPHRGDLCVDHLGKQQSADLCSTGEQKMLLLALILAYSALLGEAMVFDKNSLSLLLLDDVVAHLDHRHQAYLFQELRNRISQGIPLQVWMTGTQEKDFSTIQDISQRIAL